MCWLCQAQRNPRVLSFLSLSLSSVSSVLQTHNSSRSAKIFHIASGIRNHGWTRINLAGPVASTKGGQDNRGRTSSCQENKEQHLCCTERTITLFSFIRRLRGCHSAGMARNPRGCEPRIDTDKRGSSVCIRVHPSCYGRLRPDEWFTSSWVAGHARARSLL